MRLRIYPYSSRSVSARSVARELGGLVLKRENSQYRYVSGDIIINWGASQVPSRYPVYLNQPQAVRSAVSKTKTYQLLSANEVPTVEWTTSPVQAQDWLDQGHVVYHRSLDSSSQGRGITVMKPDSTHTEHPQGGFFTKRIAAKREFRVYCVGGRVTTILEKRRRNGVENNPYIRSHGNGYVFCRGLREPVSNETFQLTASKALQSLGLDFGGLDVLLTENGKLHVLEVNSAPGIEGTALLELCNAISEKIIHDTTI